MQNSNCLRLNYSSNEYSLIQSQKKLAIFDEKIEIRERCKGVHCVDLGESFPTRIYLQNLASIQPRTSPSTFGGTLQFNIHFTPRSSLKLVTPPRSVATYLSKAPSRSACRRWVGVPRSWRPSGHRAPSAPSRSSRKSRGTRRYGPSRRASSTPSLDRRSSRC